MTEKIWANSDDSHFIEPVEAWDALPRALRERMPRSLKDPAGEFETVYVDGQSFQRKLPSVRQQEFMKASQQTTGIADLEVRLQDLDHEGIWAEVVYPSLGMWNAMFRDPALVREAMKVSTTKPPPQVPDYHYKYWEPLWAACEEANMVLAFHIGTDPIDLAAGEEIGVVFRDPGGAVMNHTDNTIMGQRAVMKLTASGALDLAAVTAMGYRNVMWGSDYPHLEGTYGHTQETLHHLFDGVDPDTRYPITIGSFLDLFPQAGEPPALHHATQP